MKPTIVLLSLLLLLFLAANADARGGKRSVYVRGHTRSNGTYVDPHYRSAPDSTGSPAPTTRFRGYDAAVPVSTGTAPSESMPALDNQPAPSNVSRNFFLAIGAALLGGLLWRCYRRPPHDPDRIPDRVWNALSSAKKSRIKAIRDAYVRGFFTRDGMRAEIQKVIDQ